MSWLLVLGLVVAYLGIGFGLAVVVVALSENEGNEQAAIFTVILWPLVVLLVVVCVPVLWLANVAWRAGSRLGEQK